MDQLADPARRLVLVMSRPFVPNICGSTNHPASPATMQMHLSLLLLVLPFVTSTWTPPPGYYAIRPPQGKSTLRRLVCSEDRFDIDMNQMSGDGVMREKSAVHRSDL